MLIGRQEDTGFGGRIDLLAIAPDGALVLIELKRDKTPRDVVAQSLDYAGWVENQASRTSPPSTPASPPTGILGDDFQQRFGLASTMTCSTRPPGTTLFRPCSSANAISARRHLDEREIDQRPRRFPGIRPPDQAPALLDLAAIPGFRRDDGPCSSLVERGVLPFLRHLLRERSDDAVKYGFICGGGDTWYSRTLQLLNPGDRVWAKIPGSGSLRRRRPRDWPRSALP